MPNQEKLTIRSTDTIILRIRHGAVHSVNDAMTMAQALHDETGALVLLLGHDESIENLSKEAAHALYKALGKRFADA